MDTFGRQKNRQLVSGFWGEVGKDAPHFCELYLQVPTVKMGGKSPCAASWRRVKLTIMEAVSQLLESYPNLPDLGDGKCLTPAPSNILHGGRNTPNSSPPVSPRGGAGRGVACGPDNEKHVWNSQPGGLRLTKNSDLIMEQENTSPTPDHHITEGLLTQVLFTHHVRLSTQITKCTKN